MERTITTGDLRRSVAEYVNAVRLRGDCYLISQRGKEEVVLIPRWLYESYEHGRKRLADSISRIATASNRTVEEAEALALKEVSAHRAEKKNREPAAKKS